MAVLYSFESDRLRDIGAGRVSATVTIEVARIYESI